MLLISLNYNVVSVEIYLFDFATLTALKGTFLMHFQLRLPLWPNLLLKCFFYHKSTSHFATNTFVLYVRIVYIVGFDSHTVSLQDTSGHCPTLICWLVILPVHSFSCSYAYYNVQYTNTVPYCIALLQSTSCLRFVSFRIVKRKENIFPASFLLPAVISLKRHF